MQYSPMCAIPYVSTVDGGTMELVRSLGVDVVSSAELIQVFEARWTPDALESHLEAGRRVDRVRAAAFALIRERTRNGAPLQEVEVKDVRARGIRQGGPDHRQRPHCGRAMPTPPTRTTNRARRSPRRSAPAIGCCWICGPSSTSPARSTTTSPGPPSAATIRATRCARCST